MDAHFADAGQSTSEKAHMREEFRLLLDDIGHLPETQRSALVLREMDALTYEQIAEAMDTTVPSVKSLLVRARIGLAEAAEARKLTCDEVRLELGAVAEGVGSLTARRCAATSSRCERCRGFRSQLRANNKALAAIFPLGPLLLLKKALLAKLGLAKFGGASGGAAAAGGGASRRRRRHRRGDRDRGCRLGRRRAGNRNRARRLRRRRSRDQGGGRGRGDDGHRRRRRAHEQADPADRGAGTRDDGRVAASQTVPTSIYPQSAPGPGFGSTEHVAAVLRHRPSGPQLLAPRPPLLAAARHAPGAPGAPSAAALLAVELAGTKPAVTSAPTLAAVLPIGPTATPPATTPPADGSTTPLTQYASSTTTFPTGATDITGATGATARRRHQEISTTTEFSTGPTATATDAPTTSTTTQEISTTTVFQVGTTGSTTVTGSTGTTSATGSSGATGTTSATGSSGATGATSATGSTRRHRRHLRDRSTGTTGATSATGATGRTGATARPDPAGQRRRAPRPVRAARRRRPPAPAGRRGATPRD